MLEVIVFSGAVVVLLCCLGMAARFWGADSRDPMDHPEWERRQAWFGGRRSTR